MFVRCVLGSKKIGHAQSVLDKLLAPVVEDVPTGLMGRVLTLGHAKPQVWLHTQVKLNPKQFMTLRKTRLDEFLPRLTQAFPDWKGGLDGPGPPLRNSSRRRWGMRR